MRYFRCYIDDTMRPLDNHDSGYLIGRKPIVLDFNTLKRKKIHSVKGAATRLGKAFAERIFNKKGE